MVSSFRIHTSAATVTKQDDFAVCTSPYMDNFTPTGTSNTAVDLYPCSAPSVPDLLATSVGVVSYVCGTPNSGGPSDGQNGDFQCTHFFSINGCEYSYVNTYETTTRVWAQPLFRGVWTQPTRNPKGCPKASNLDPIKIDSLDNAVSSLSVDQYTFALRKAAFKTPLDL
jgi:hypothetical protein